MASLLYPKDVTLHIHKFFRCKLQSFLPYPKFLILLQFYPIVTSAIAKSEKITWRWMSQLWEEVHGSWEH